MNNPLVELDKYGQSVWLDNISREIIEDGTLEKLIENDGVKGVTSNPSIFQKAMGSGKYYDAQITSLLQENMVISTEELYEELAVKDIQDAADAFYKLFNSSGGKNGFVSLEVSPTLAYDTEGTIEAADRLFRKTDRPNVMIKIPATTEGIPAIKEMIARGVNINVTLIFSEKLYEEVVEAYISGLEKRISEGLEIKGITSVASFFISRIDTAVDKELDKTNDSQLKGKAAIANAKLVYQKAKKLFSSDRFRKLNDKGAFVQRLLWASTGTKNPAYPDTYYVDELIGDQTVNTMPPATLDAFRDHGTLKDTIELDLNQARENMDLLKEFGINFTDITDKLTKDGVVLFLDAYYELLKALHLKKFSLLNGIECSTKYFLPEETSKKVSRRTEEWSKNNFAERFWKKDYKLWKENKKDDVELSDKMGWLKLPNIMQKELKRLEKFAGEVRKEFDHIFLLGMGGSSLAPEVFFKVFGKKEGYPDLRIVDSTHPEFIRDILENYNLRKCIFIVASKSGGTTETMSFFYLFYDAVSKLKDNPGENFIAVTDQGTSLEKLAKERKFRRIFTTPAEVGGRYSALAYFGLLPAALIGTDVGQLLERGESVMNGCSELTKVSKNQGFLTGAVIGELAANGIDKLTFLSAPAVSSFIFWVEQLIAESTGKEGKGILPVTDDIPGVTEVYHSDRAFVYMKIENERSEILDHLVNELITAGFPVIMITLKDIYDIGGEFFRWEIATAAAGSVLGINPFDQPDVQLAKSFTLEAMKSFSETGKLPESEKVFMENGISVAGDVKGKDLKTAISGFFTGMQPGTYTAVMLFVKPSAETDKAVEELKIRIREKYKIAVTSGYGPRFLHSTGQFHKGGANNGLFIQITSEILDDIEIPETSYSFGTLITAQSNGDMRALTSNGRKVLKLIVKDDTAKKIKAVASLF